MSELSPSAFVIAACASRVVDALLFLVLLLSLPAVLRWWSLWYPLNHMLCHCRRRGKTRRRNRGHVRLCLVRYSQVLGSPTAGGGWGVRVVGGSAASWRDRATGLPAPAAQCSEAVGATASGGWSQAPPLLLLASRRGLWARLPWFRGQISGTAYADPPVLPLPCVPLHPP